MHLDGLAFWAQARLHSIHHRVVCPCAGAAAQLAVSVPVPGPGAERLSPMAVILFQEPLQFYIDSFFCGGVRHITALASSPPLAIGGAGGCLSATLDSWCPANGWAGPCRVVGMAWLCDFYLCFLPA